MLAIQTFFENLSGIGFAAIYSDVLRYILPLLALLILMIVMHEQLTRKTACK